jgi:hypothetical protein
MGVFRQKDRDKRRTRRDLHVIAMDRARDSIRFVDPELSRHEWENEEWDDYVSFMMSHEVLPVSRERFLRELYQ